MKKSKTLIALTKLNKDASKLLAKSELDLAATEFLANEANRLIQRSEDDSIPYDEKERIFAQMVELLKRIDYEKGQGEMDDVEMARLQKEVNNV